MEYTTLTIGLIVIGLLLTFLCVICTLIYHSQKQIVTRMNNQREMIAKNAELQVAILRMILEEDEEDSEENDYTHTEEDESVDDFLDDGPKIAEETIVSMHGKRSSRKIG